MGAAMNSRDGIDSEIGKVRRTMLGYEAHGILTAYLDIDFGSASQSVGGYSLDSYDDVRKQRIGHAACGVFVAGILRACGVDAWEKVQGRTILVLRKGNRPVGIDPLPTEPGERFLFDELKSVAD
jgi:hypothetical protein